jgi:hypothetical protein
VVLSSSLCLGLPSGLLPLWFQKKTLYAFHFCPTNVTHPAHFIFLISGSEYKLWSSLLCSFLQAPHFLLGPKTLSLFSLLTPVQWNPLKSRNGKWGIPLYMYWVCKASHSCWHLFTDPWKGISDEGSSNWTEALLPGTFSPMHIIHEEFLYLRCVSNQMLIMACLAVQTQGVILELIQLDRTAQSRTCAVYILCAHTFSWSA